MTISRSKLETAEEVIFFDDDTGVEPIATELEVIDDDLSLEDPNDWPSFPNPFKHPIQSPLWVIRTLFGVAVIVLLLAIVAAVPVLSLLVLGYLLDVEGRVARSGRFRDGFPLLIAAPRIGTIALGITLWLLPLFFVSGMASDAALIDPTGNSAARWHFARVVLSVTIAVHLCLALARGGSMGCFIRPLKNVLWLISELRNRPLKKKLRCSECGETHLLDATNCQLCGERFVDAEHQPLSMENSYWHRVDRKIANFLGTLQIKYHFKLGFRGLLGAMSILILPTVLFSVAKTPEGIPILLTVIGGFCLAILFLSLPFLQANFAAQNRLGAMYELRKIRKMFLQTPFTFFLALLAVYASALPLFIFSAFAPPRDAMWLITVVVIASIYPARIVTGWAFHRAAKKMNENKKIAWVGWRWLCRLLMFATTMAYTLIFFFTRDIGAHGKLVLFEHHAFLGTVMSSLFSWLP